MQPTIHVRHIQDRGQLARFLDPYRDSYMVGDLDAPYWDQTVFYGAFKGDAGLIAVAARFDPIAPPPLITAGDPAGVAAIYARLAEPASGTPARIFYHAQDAHLEALRAHYAIDPAEHIAMWRMVCTAEQLTMPHAVDSGAVRLLRLTDADLTRVRDHLPAPRQLQPEWVFYAVMADDVYVAIAGTHIVSPGAGIGVIGWVYTHPPYRGRGYAAACTAAVSAALVAQGIPLLALNVRQDNVGAIRAYERCGYRIYNGLWEGEAVVRGRP